MFKKLIPLMLTAVLVFSLAGCGCSNTSSSGSSNSTNNTSTGGHAVTDAPAIGTVANTLAQDKDALISNYSSKFQQKTYSDSSSGLSITYNLFLPEGYDASKSYPMVVFIADSSCTGNDATKSLTQGRGGLVFATNEWQSVYPTIVAVPTYPETILDDHGSYTTTEYVELTKRYIDYMSSEYSVDKSRIYGTGQSMGCMTTLILASKYPDLYAACMFVDGQWDISQLSGLQSQRFIYFAAEDDTNAWNGAQEVMKMFDSAGVSYGYAQWDGTWSVNDLSSNAQTLFAQNKNQNFISWKTGTIEPKSGGMGGSAPSGSGKPSGSGGPSGSGSSGETNSSSYHMASFDYAYNCVACMEWMFHQKK
ncbi:MAG: prolyl oligopeptidase family serine peptidase [Lachnospiraceae bacterium]|nr:prolyl oligopeptidase family serine peptidase [Lachnospiraceae bacterium]